MTKRNFKKSQTSSFCPRSSVLLGQEIEEEKMMRMGKGAYYASKGRLRSEHEKAVFAEAMEESVRRKRSNKLRKDRWELIKEMAELNNI